MQYITFYEWDQLNKNLQQQVLSLWQHCFGTHHIFPNILLQEDIRRKAIKLFEHGQMIMAVDDNTVAGIIIYCETLTYPKITFSNYLWSFMVSPAYRGQGLGKILLRKGVEISSPKEAIGLITWHNRINGAIALYNKAGFKTTHVMTLPKYDLSGTEGLLQYRRMQGYKEVILYNLAQSSKLKQA